MTAERGWVAGVDEAGRGPIFGPVYASAVVLDPARPLPGLADSKQLTASRRELLAQCIRRDAIAWAIAKAEVAEIDQINILQASLLAMRRCILALTVPLCRVLVDGNRAPVGLPCAALAEVRGDARIPVISAASILAKTARDAELQHWDGVYPGYGLARHKGYPTRVHLEALRRLGVTPQHRRTFAPVRSQLALVASVEQPLLGH